MSLPPSPTPLHVPLIQVTVRCSFLRPPVSDHRSEAGRCVSGPWTAPTCSASVWLCGPGPVVFKCCGRETEQAQVLCCQQ